MKNDVRLIKKINGVLNNVFSRVILKEPYYTQLREVQRDIYIYLNKEEYAKRLRKEGKTIRQIAKEMGFDNPGSITFLLSKNNSK